MNLRSWMTEAEWLVGPPARYHDMRMLASGVQLPLMTITPEVIIGINCYLQDNIVIAIGRNGETIRLVLEEEHGVQ